jgi:hypothetical protein
MTRHPYLQIFNGLLILIFISMVAPLALADRDDSHQKHGKSRAEQQEEYDQKKSMPPQQQKKQTPSHSHQKQQSQQSQQKSRPPVVAVPPPQLNSKSAQKSKYQHTHKPTVFVPTRHKFYPYGMRVNILPRTHVRVVVGGGTFYYNLGVFYQPSSHGYIVVSAPFGAVVSALPAGYISFNIGATPYYYINSTYYTWDVPRVAYVVVEEPVGAAEAIAKSTDTKLFIYPKEGQNEELQAQDRYECHRWAVNQTGYDPSLVAKKQSKSVSNDYKRAMTACLEARGYSVQ